MPDSTYVGSAGSSETSELTVPHMATSSPLVAHEGCIRKNAPRAFVSLTVPSTALPACHAKTPGSQHWSKMIPRCQGWNKWNITFYFNDWTEKFRHAGLHNFSSASTKTWHLRAKSLDTLSTADRFNTEVTTSSLSFLKDSAFTVIYTHCQGVCSCSGTGCLSHLCWKQQ